MNLDMFSINVNFTLLVALVGIIEFIKKQDYKNKLKPIYWLISLALNAVIGIFVTDWSSLADKTLGIKFLQVCTNIFIYFGISTLLYQYILKSVQTIMDKFLKKPQSTNSSVSASQSPSLPEGESDPNSPRG